MNLRSNQRACKLSADQCQLCQLCQLVFFWKVTVMKGSQLKLWLLTNGQAGSVRQLQALARLLKEPYAMFDVGQPGDILSHWVFFFVFWICCCGEPKGEEREARF